LCKYIVLNTISESYITVLFLIKSEIEEINLPRLAFMQSKLLAD
jgi:hypothetical protein